MGATIAIWAVFMSAIGPAYADEPATGQLRIVNSRLVPEKGAVASSNGQIPQKAPSAESRGAPATTPPRTGKQAVPVNTGPGDGSSFSIRRDRTGVFFVNGSINGAPVRFKVDPGVAMTAVDGKISRLVGIRSGRGAKVMVGNTEVKAMIGLAPVVAGDVFADVEVAVYAFPSGGETAVLGQNFLSKFHVVEAKDRLTISPK